jgi:hypothetical protein
MISKMFEPNKVPTEIYILSYAHISFKINISPFSNKSPPPLDQQNRQAGSPQRLGMSGLVCVCVCVCVCGQQGSGCNSSWQACCVSDTSE